jgi:hypothetical protein
MQLLPSETSMRSMTSSTDMEHKLQQDGSDVLIEKATKAVTRLCMDLQSLWLNVSEEQAPNLPAVLTVKDSL